MTDPAAVVVPLASPVPAELFLGLVIALGAAAAVGTTIGWLAPTQLDKVLLGFSYLVGAVGFGLTGDLALVFAPPAMTLGWLLVRERFGRRRRARRRRPRSGRTGSSDDGGSGPAGSDSRGDGTALAPGDLTTEPPGHDFEDVGGMADLKATLEDRVIEPLAEPDRYDAYGIGAVNGVLFYGPPGCGKTFLASAVASETGYNYLEVSPAEITSKYIGEAADNVATLFETARENEPCLVFLDEIDAIAGDRADHMATSEQQMVNQLLTELESQDDAEIVVFAATNYLEDVDDAILRSGRFDERIEVPPPDREARREILALELSDAPTAEHVALGSIADGTAGYASSDVELLGDVAARHAIADEAPIQQSHLQQALAETETSIPGWLDRYEDRFEEDLRRGPTQEPVPFEELPGMEEIAETVDRRVLGPVRHAEYYEEYGVEPVHGALLVGPPDAGKSTVARSIAAELDRDSIEISPDRFRREGVTELADRAAEIVEDARDAAPSVLLLDDLEELAPADGGSHAHRELASRLASLLPTLEGDEVLVVGTAGSIGAVDADVLHAGAFDERIEVPPPDGATRAAILGDELPGTMVESDVELAAVAEATEGFSIRDLRHLAGRVARQALRREEKVSTDRLVEEAEAVEPTLADWQPSRSAPAAEDIFEPLRTDD